MSPSARAGDSFPAPRAASSIPSGASPPALAEFGVAAALAAPSAAAQHADGVQAPSDGASLPVGHPSCSEVPAQLRCPQQVTLVEAVAGWVPRCHPTVLWVARNMRAPPQAGTMRGAGRQLLQRDTGGHQHQHQVPRAGGATSSSDGGLEMRNTLSSLCWHLLQARPFPREGS